MEKVELLVDRVTTHSYQPRGTVLDVPKAEAERMFKHGQAKKPDTKDQK